MGSEGVFVDVDQAAAILGVTSQMVHKYVENGMLPGHYPHPTKTGGKGPRMFRREDVETLEELRASDLLTNRASLFRHVLGTAVKVRRLERTLDELLCYIGMSDHKLPTEHEDVIRFYAEAEDFCTHNFEVNDAQDVAWARRLLPFSEEYLEVVRTHTGSREPWVVFLESLNRILLRHPVPGPVRAVLEHSRMNLRNVAYFFARHEFGARTAKTIFPNESYSSRLYKTLLPAE